MEVELDPALLVPQRREDLALLALCALGQMGRHRIFPRNRTAWDQWAYRLSPDLRDEVLLAWDESERRANEGVASERVLVVPAGPDRYDQAPIQLTPREALSLLGRPLRVLLENGRNDRGFLLAFADVATQRALLDAERAGWVVFETAGGINELRVRLEEAHQSAPREVFRTMVLCDSDALERGAPSEVARKVEERLNEMEQRYRRPRFHFGRVLLRRAAENYAPPGAILQWALEGFGANAWQLLQAAEDPRRRARLRTNVGTPGSTRRHLLAAIALRELAKAEREHADANRAEEARRLRDVRGHLDMKLGRFRRGAPPGPDIVRTAESIWSQLDDLQAAALMDGFGSTFSASFYDGRVGLQDETGEVEGMLATIMERI